jgi:hypothetical protein
MLGIRTCAARSEGSAVGGARILATILPAMAFAGSAIAATAVDPEAVALATTPTPSMYYARAGHTETALGNGLILIAGGASNPSAELYHPTYNTFTITGDMRYSREGHTATLLGTGQALIAGGTTLSSTAELYDPLTGRFSDAGSMHYVRTGHTATRLPTGHVLLAGGQDASGTLTSAEIYNPATHTFTLTGSMSTARRNHTATMLPNGKVLVAGGSSLATAELFDPSTGHFTPTGALRVGRFNHTATMLPSGRVLLVGGYAATGGPMVSAELYSVSTGTFTLTGSLTSPHAAHTATLRGDGTVLVVGGFQGWHTNVTPPPDPVELCSIVHVPCGAAIPNPTVELFHPTTGQFSAAGSGPAVGGHGAARIPAVGELVTGGEVMTRRRVVFHIGLHIGVAYVFENEPTNSAVLIPGD